MKRTVLLMVLFVSLVLIITTAFVFMKNDDEKTADVTGYVFSIVEDGFLVAEGIRGESLYDGDIERLVGEAIRFTVMEKTDILDNIGDKVSFSDISVYDEVEVWIEGAINESYPAQGEALKVRITGNIFDPKEDVLSVTCDDTNSARLSVIQSLENAWPELESELSERPTLGVESWQEPYHVQFIGNDKILVAFEDGHIILTTVLKFECKDGDSISGFTLLDDETIYEFPLSESVWSDLRDNLGNIDRSVNTYTSIPVYTEGVMIDVYDWQEIDANIFIMDLGHGHKL